MNTISNRVTGLFAFAVLLAAAFSSPLRAQSSSTAPSRKPMEMPREANGEAARREQYYHDKRAGGPGRIISKTAYENSIQQMLAMKEERSRFAPSALPAWADVSKGGESYGGTYASGRAVQIAFDPTNNTTMYLASAGGGVWKSTDDGTTWNPLTDHLTTSACGAIAVDPNNSQKIFYASGEENFSLDSYYGEGLFRSTDGGTTWAKVASTTAGNYYSQIVISPTNSNIIYAANDKGIIRSTNGGTLWTLLTTGQGNVGLANCIIINPLNPNTLYATFGGYEGTEAQFGSNVAEKSTDGGTTWTVLGGYTGVTTGRTSLALSPSDTNYIYGASVSYNGSGGIYQSTDAGISWTRQNHNTNYMGAPPGAQDWYDNSIAVNPTDPMDIVVGGLDIYESTDGGQTLTQIAAYATPPHPDVHSLTYNGNYLYACTDGGVYRTSNDGANWLTLNRTVSTLEYQGADYAHGNTAIVLGGMQDNGRSITGNAGTTVTLDVGGDGGYVEIDQSNANVAYGSYYDNSIGRTTNEGSSWVDIYPSTNDSTPFYPPFHLAPSNDQRLVYGLKSIWENQAAGTVSGTGSGWTAILPSSQSPGLCSAIGISYSNPSKIYAGFESGRVMVTTNNGTNWNTSSFADWVGDIAVDPTNDSVAYATMTGFDNLHVYKTTNSGSSWTNVTGNLPNTPTNSIVIRSNPPRMLIVGTDIGVFNSTDDGSHWASLDNGLPIAPIYDLKYHEGDKVLLAATHGRGCWEYNLGSYGFAASSTSLAFGAVNYGAALVESLTVSNGGNVTLNISGVTTTDTEYTVTPDSASIVAGGSQAFAITFTPKGAGSKNTTISFTDDGVTSPDRISATGTGISSIFSDNKTSIAFGPLLLGNSKLDSVKVTNTGNSMLHLTVASSDSAFQVTPAVDSIAPAGSHQVHVLFDPATSGIKSAGLVFTTDSPNSPDTVALTGTAGVSTVELRVFRDSSQVIVTSKWGISLYQDSVSAGTLVGSATSADYSFIVVSAGTYIAAEADSGNIVRENGNGTRYDTLNVPNNQTVVDTFVNRYFSISVASNQAWNLVSSPVIAKDSSVFALFPSASNGMFGYDTTGYTELAYLRRGVGYWLKFPAAAVSTMLGEPLDSLQVHLNKGWNLVGALSTTVASSDLSTNPPDISSPLIWGYHQGYFLADSLVPGKAYWMNVTQAGTMQVPAAPGGAAAKSKLPVLDGLNQLVLTDAHGTQQTLYFGEPAAKAIDTRLFQAPPSAPAGMFDARYANGAFFAATSFSHDPHASLDIMLKSASYPVTITWKLTAADHAKYALSAAQSSSQGPVSLKGLTGSTTIRDAKVKSISIGLESADLPKVFALEQNYPNPFNPTTVIKYQLPADSRVTLKIFNVLGEEITTLLNGTQTAGFRSITWNGLDKNFSAVSSGMYFYRLEATTLSAPATSFVQSKKMMVIK